MQAWGLGRRRGRADCSSVAVAGDEVAQLEVDVDVHVGAALGAGASAAVRQLVCSLVGVDANVRRDPVDDDRDGEVADEELELLGEVGVGAGAPAQGEDPPGVLTVCE